MLVQNVPKATCELLPLTYIFLKSRLSYLPSILFTNITIRMHLLMYPQAWINPILTSASRTDYFVQSYLSLFCLAVPFFILIMVILVLFHAATLNWNVMSLNLYFLMVDSSSRSELSLTFTKPYISIHINLSLHKLSSVVSV